MAEHIDTFLDQMVQGSGAKARKAAERLIKEGEKLGMRVATQKVHASKGAALPFVIPGLARWFDATPIVLFAKGRITWQFAELRRHDPFRSQEREDELRKRLAAFPSTKLAKKDWPDMSIEDLTTAEGMKKFVETLSWVVDRIRGSNRS